MSLSFDLSRITDRATLCFHPGEDGEMKGVTQALIFATMAIGMPEITAANAEEFATRISAWEHVAGPMLSGKGADGEPNFLTLAQVKAHVGLSTNSDRKTITKFRADLGITAMERAAYRIRQG